MKKLLLVILLITTVFMFAACNGRNGETPATSDNKTTGTDNSEETDNNTATATETKTATATDPVNNTQDIERCFAEILDTLMNDKDLAPDKSLQYYIYDIDKNGVKELIARTGNDEASYMYRVYAYVDGGAPLAGEFSGSHSILYGCSDGLYNLVGHMGAMDIFKITLNNNVITEVIMLSKQLGEDEEYDITFDDNEGILEGYEWSETLRDLGWI